METILISWLEEYTGHTVTKFTTFNSLNFDIFDEAVVVDFVKSQFGVNVNKQEQWFESVKDLVDEITNST